MLRNVAAPLKREASHQGRKGSWGKWQGLPSIRKHILIGSASAVLLILGAYRILTFVPQPLDSPKTLRPALYAIFTAFVKHYSDPERAQQAWANLCLVALFIPVLLALLNYFRTPSPRKLTGIYQILSSRVLFLASIAASLLLCRFPSLLVGQINPDEELFIAAAHKLFRDPVFFRAVDCGTSGPLNIFPLMLPALFGFSPDYASTRLIAALMLFLSIYLVFRAFNLLTGEAIARVAILPMAAAFAVLRDPQLQHYSAQTLVLLTALAIYLCIALFCSPASHAWTVVRLGLVAGAAFLAKLQAVPIIACVSLVAIAYTLSIGQARQLWPSLRLFAGGFVPLLALNAVVCWLTGVWNDFWMEYIVSNYSYVTSQAPFTVAISDFGNYILGAGDIHLLLVTLAGILAAYVYRTRRRERLADQALFLRMGIVSGSVAIGAAALLQPGSTAATSAGVLAIALLPGFCLLFYRNRGIRQAPIPWFGLLVSTLVASSIVAVYVPHRGYIHYLLLLVLPMTMAMAWPVIVSSLELKPQSEKDSGVLPRGFGVGSEPAFVLLFASLIVVYQWSRAGLPYFVSFAKVPATVRVAGIELVDAVTQQEDEIAVWGWDSRVYLSAGRVSAAKDIAIAQLFFSGPEVIQYYRRSYLSSLRNNPPKIFIDAIDTSWGLAKKRAIYGYWSIPEIGSFVQSKYVHVVDLQKRGYYVRRDLVARAAAVVDRLGLLPDVCEIVCRLNGKALSLPGDFTATGNGVLAVQSSYTSVPSQQWELVSIDGTYYKIVSKMSGKVLDVVGGSAAIGNGTPVGQWDYLGGTNQEWKLVRVEGRYYEIVSRLSGKLLEVQDGVGAAVTDGGIQIWERTGGWNQQWQLIPAQ